MAVLYKLSLTNSDQMNDIDSFDADVKSTRVLEEFAAA